uniref:DUF131 domain-containing protein n=1 Tax=Candidatus Methanomethylicus mesodigestus TaxID=1867258 RepID=A0A7C3FAX5_9CREN
MGLESGSLVALGALLIIAGIFVLARRGRGEGGALIMIGPIPIAIGSSPRALKVVMIFSLIFILVALALMI